MVLFDYMFYRLATFFMQKDGPLGVRAQGVLSAFQGLWVVILFFTLRRHFLTHAAFAPFSRSTSQVIAILLTLPLMYGNFRRYRSRYAQLADQWQNHSPRESTIGGFLVVMLLISPFCFMYATLR